MAIMIIYVIIYTTIEGKEIVMVPTLEFEKLLTSLKHNRTAAHSFLLGAGASVESGIKSAGECIWDWKRDIYVSSNLNRAEYTRDLRLESVQNEIQCWLDNRGGYPKRGAKEEYVEYAEKTFYDPEDRKQYFYNICEGKTPSLGYDLITFLFKRGMVKTVWTTNFDGLIVTACYNNRISHFEVTLETKDRVNNRMPGDGLLCIALHGEYKYGPLKNTANELDTQSDVLIEALAYELKDRDIIVLGYSGRDISLMESLKQALQRPGSGRLYWCGYNGNISEEAEELINEVNKNGRKAYFVSTSGFDNMMLDICRCCFEGDAELEDLLYMTKKAPFIPKHVDIEINVPEVSFNVEYYVRHVKDGKDEWPENDAEPANRDIKMSREQNGKYKGTVNAQKDSGFQFKCYAKCAPEHIDELAAALSELYSPQNDHFITSANGRYPKVEKVNNRGAVWFLLPGYKLYETKNGSSTFLNNYYIFAD